MTRQIGVRAMLLLTAAFAAWFAYYQNRAEIARLNPRIASMRSLARELVVADESKITVVKNDELWEDDNRWEASLPAGEYRLNLATREVIRYGLPPAAKGVAIPAGRHQLALEQVQEGEVYRIIVTLDGHRVMEVEEPKDWNLGSGWSEGVSLSTAKQFDDDEPIVLFRRRFLRPDAWGLASISAGPTEGILLWIERVR
jgi:hypothetical protein